MKYNLAQARSEHQHTLLTFGGAWSNHIYATAAAGKRFGFNTIGIIRGESSARENPTLQFAQECGMRLEFIDRKTYRDKASHTFIQQLHEQFGDFYLVPEGGSNQLALKGCAEIVTDIDIDFNVIASACGTGATLAGIITALKPEQHAIGFAVLKGAEFLKHDITRLLKNHDNINRTNWHLETDYHFGGYAKTTPELFDFIIDFKKTQGITLDVVYTGKMFYGLYDLIEKGRFDKGTRIIAIHTGGIQGNLGFPELSG